jgi:hypothetical protein
MAQKQTKKVNGITDLDTPQMASLRATVIEQELSARSWKAYYEKMYYALESEKLEGPFKEYQERAKARAEEDKKKMEEFLKAMNEEIAIKNEQDPVGELKVEEAN